MKATWKECSFNLMLFPQQSCFLLLLLHKSDFFLSDFILLLEGRVGRWIPPGWNVHRTSSYLSTKKEIANKIWNFYQSGVSKNWWYNFFIFTLVTLVTRVTLVTLVTLASLITLVTLLSHQSCVQSIRSGQTLLIIQKKFSEFFS